MSVDSVTGLIVNAVLRVTPPKLALMVTVVGATTGFVAIWKDGE